jgi:hypothetical protein
MKNLIATFSVLLFFALVDHCEVIAQGLQGRVIQSIFFGENDGDGERISLRLGLDEVAMYDSIINRVSLLLNLDSIVNLQYKPFIYKRGKKRDLKTLTLSDRSRAETDAADLYLKIFVDVDMAYPTMVFSNLIKSMVTIEVFVFGKDFHPLTVIEGKKSSTGLTTSKDDEDLSFFDLDNEGFWSLFNKALDDIYKYPK